MKTFDERCIEANHQWEQGVIEALLRVPGNPVRYAHQTISIDDGAVMASKVYNSRTAAMRHYNDACDWLGINPIDGDL